jgi:ATP-dependent DNA helicase RecQ
MTADHSYSHTENVEQGVINSKSQGGVSDAKLLGILKDLRKKVAKKRGIPPFAIFQDSSLEAMALRYPISIEELSSVHGVGDGKAKKFGKEFVALIERYVKDNDILRPDDLIVKGTGVKSGLKLFIIQNTDRKLSLEDISKSKGLEMNDLIKEIETIVYSGTKLNISYCLDDILDEEQQEEIMEYFMESETDDIQTAIDEFDGDYEEEDMRLMRIKFLSEVAN